MSTTRTRLSLAGIVFTVLFAQVLLYPGVDVLVTAFGADTPLNASMWFLAAEFGAFVAFAGVWGAASDAAGRRVPFVIAAALGGVVGYVALATLPAQFALPFEAILFLRAFQGATTIGAFSLAMTMLMDLEGGHGRNMGAAGIAIGAGTALGAPVGGQLFGLGPFVPLYAAALLLLFVALVAWTVPDGAPAQNRDSVTRAVSAGVRETPALTLPYAFGFIDRLTAGFFALVGTLYFRTVFELSPAATGLLLALFFAPFGLLQYPFGVLSDRIGRTVPIVAGSALYGLGVVAVGYAPTVELVAVAMVAVGVLGALMAPATMALVTDLASPSGRGVAMAGFNAFGSLGFLVGILLGGTVAGTFGYLTAFVVIGLLELGLALMTVPVFLRLDADRKAVFTR
ncbi:MFS transporter [Halomicroarcula sp. GCM10025324]|uniref:MFS transporter n=1 Tax=Haloarcula TaxID=2237 RepID=UPI0023E8AA15|nr:MFS transporter [Halomicroarcula sp. ZS-22-S1]